MATDNKVSEISAEANTFGLTWKPTFHENGKKHIVGESVQPIQVTRRFDNTAPSAKPQPLYAGTDSIVYKPRSGTNKQPVKVKVENTLIPRMGMDYVSTYLNLGHDTIIHFPLNSSMVLAREYGAQSPNRIVQYQTLSGTSVSSFGQGIKKIALKVTIIKAGILWIPYASALEALAELSGNNYRYSGALFLNGFDQSNPGKARRYKVIVDSISNSTSSDTNNIVNYDISFLVTFDYSSSRLGSWGKL